MRSSANEHRNQRFAILYAHFWIWRCVHRSVSNIRDVRKRRHLCWHLIVLFGLTFRFRTTNQIPNKQTSNAFIGQCAGLTLHFKSFVLLLLPLLLQSNIENDNDILQRCKLDPNRTKCVDKQRNFFSIVHDFNRASTKSDRRRILEDADFLFT